MKPHLVRSPGSAAAQQLATVYLPASTSPDWKSPVVTGLLPALLEANMVACHRCRCTCCWA